MSTLTEVVVVVVEFLKVEKLMKHIRNCSLQPCPVTVVLLPRDGFLIFKCVETSLCSYPRRWTSQAGGRAPSDSSALKLASGSWNPFMLEMVLR